MLYEKERQTLIKVLKEKISKQLLYYLDVCARCAICANACHQYKVTKDIKYIPAYRAELIRRLYKKYFSVLGRFVPKLYESKLIDDEVLLNELYQVTYACTGCRRCMYYCPFSIDTIYILSVAKSLLIAAGRENQILKELTDAAIMKGESIDLFKDVFISILKDAEPDLRNKTGDGKAIIPVDKKGADVLYVALSGMHSILPAAVIFNKASVNWTLSMFEASNYGYFLGDTTKAIQIADRIVQEAKKLKVKEVIITECGHAYRVMNFFYEAWTQKKLPFKVTALVDAVYRFVKEGKIELKNKAVKEITTYHDPCQFGRNGGFFEEPRYLVLKIAENFKDLNPNRAKAWCCGGGGGVVAIPELEEFRLKTGEIKARQIKETGAKIIISPCENCRLQFDSLNARYNLGLQVKSLVEFVSDNVVF